MERMLGGTWVSRRHAFLMIVTARADALLGVRTVRT